MTAPILIPCPECGAELKLKDRRLLGRKGRCPSCQHVFVLQEPDEIELELATDAAPASPAMGTGARHVPDEPSAADPASAGVGPLIDVGDDSGSGIASLPTGGASRKTVRRKKKAKKQNRMIQSIAGGVVAMVCLGGYFMYSRSNATDDDWKEGTETRADGSSVTRTTDDEGQRIEVINKGPKADVNFNNQVQAAKDAFAAGEATSPTNGDFIKLRFIPQAHVVIHLRPADLWANTRQMEEFRNCLTPAFTTWLAGKIKELTFYEPAEVEELTLGLFLEQRGRPIGYSGLVRLKEPRPMSEFITNFGGTPNRDHGYPLYYGSEYVYAVDNDDLAPDDQGRNTRPRTFAFGPTLTAAEMAESREGSILVNSDIKELLPQTDRDRHFTAIFIQSELLKFEDYLFGENLRPAANRLLNWFGDDVRSVAWSIHLGDPDTSRPFFSEILLRNSNAIGRPANLKRVIDKKLAKLGPQLVEMVRRMNPPTQGRRDIIGRFPAMIEAFRLNTLSGITARTVQLTTVLPERAGPNLAVGTLLTWNQSTMTDFSAAIPVAVVPKQPQLPPTIAGRLAMPLDHEFNRTPLKDAFEIMADNLQLNLVVDGDAIKLARMTQNMPQNFDRAVTPTTNVIQTILDRYTEEGLVVLFDEPTLTITLTSRDAANAQSKPIAMQGKAAPE